MHRHHCIWAFLVFLFSPATLSAQDFGGSARQFELAINENYAYLERLEGAEFRLSPVLITEAERVQTATDLLAFLERATFLLADHHLITGSSFADSWGIVPSYSDMWVELQNGEFVITDVRANTPASEAGVEPGDLLIAIGDVRIEAAVAAFWEDLGATSNLERDGFAARVLATGRRDRARDVTIANPQGEMQRLTLANLYMVDAPSRPSVSTQHMPDGFVIRFNDSLGQFETIAAFDAAMSQIGPDDRIILDLTDTASGGNTTVARAVMGWFVSAPTPYQTHTLPAEQRQTGIARQWTEYVLPRDERHHPGPVEVRVGRWTGSMGEGLAIGMDAVGAEVTGTPMAGLLGAVYDMPVGDSGLIIKLPVERLYHVDGTPREHFVPQEST